MDTDHEMNDTLDGDELEQIDSSDAEGATFQDLPVGNEKIKVEISFPVTSKLDKIVDYNEETMLLLFQEMSTVVSAADAVDNNQVHRLTIGVAHHIYKRMQEYERHGYDYFSWFGKTKNVEIARQYQTGLCKKFGVKPETFRKDGAGECYIYLAFGMKKEWFIVSSNI